MNENNNDNEDIELSEQTETSEQILEEQKKQKEITLKRKETSPFKIDNPESLEIMEEESFYRNPSTNIIESENLYYILVELPGLDKKNVKISVHEGILELIGEKAIEEKDKKDEKKDKDKEKKEKKDEKKDKDKKKEKHKKIKGNYLRREIRTTNFFRRFHLPEDINTEEIDASFKNGILRLEIPKKSASTSEKKVIEIK